MQRPVPGGWFATVHLKAFDPDHFQDGGPANTAADGDPNDHDPNSHQPDDNYGSGVGMLPLTSHITFYPGQTLKWSEEFSVRTDSRQPGNNFIVGTNGRQERVDHYQFRKSDGTTLILMQNGQETVVPQAYQTPMLTVWRTLWMEQDDMVAPDPRPMPVGDGPFDGAGVGNDDVQMDPHEPPITLATTNLAAALVRVQQLPAQYDQKDGVDFVHNLPFGLFETKGRPVRDVDSERYFWVVHLIGAYECDTSIDHDPNTETGLFGYDSGLMSDAPIYVFLETARDLVANTPGMVPLNTYENRGALHETLHQFLGPHSQDPNNPSNPVADEGVMDYTIAATGTAAENQLTPHQIRVLQGRTYPGNGYRPAPETEAQKCQQPCSLH